MDGILSDELKQNETFASYVERFSTDAEYRRIANKTIKANYTQSQKENDLAKHIISSIIAMEKEKLYYYMLCESNPSRVLVLKTPTKNAELKNFKDIATLIKANNDTVITLMQLNNMLVSKNQQLTKATEIIQKLYNIVCGRSGDDWELIKQAEQFLRGVEE